jgi:asparagine synthase (glutamine-hydrolysing)
MCGIFGVFDRTGATPNRRRLESAASLLQHRGPDSFGIHAEPGLGLVHTRLALLDLSERGRQPFWDAEQRYCLVYNGEIYNFLEIRRGLESRGIVFNTGTDTEVLLQALMADGPEAILPRLQGMFAFAFLDRDDHSLLLARDRFGIKPLLIRDDGDTLMFASEVSAMRPFTHPCVHPFQSVAYLMGFGGPTQGASLFEGVRFVPTGTAIRISLRDGHVSSRRFAESSWALEIQQAETLGSMKDEAIVDLVDAQLSSAVDQMLVADATVGALCSGGVDSSIIMAMAARKHRDLAIFHANVLGPASEYEAAHDLASHLGLDLSAVEVRDEHFVELIPDVTRHYEQPFHYHPNSIPFLMVARLVRESGVKAVLSGEGSDEAFLGYQWLAQEPFQRRLRQTTSIMRRSIRQIPTVGPRLIGDVDPTSRLVRGLLSGFEREIEERTLDERFARAAGQPSDGARTLHLLGYHLRTLLHRNDRLGMAASIEARFPFLDESLVATAVNLPRRFKIRPEAALRERAHPFLVTKWVLRKVADRYLPTRLSRRPKRGFPVSAFDRMRVEPGYFQDSFVSSYFRLGADELSQLLSQAHPPLVLRLLLFDVWGRLCVEDEDVDGIRRRLHRNLKFVAL